MTMPKLLSAAALFVTAAAFVTPAMAANGREVTQEPGVVGFNYPDSRYMTGGYGVRAAPGPDFYFWHPAPGAVLDAPRPAYRPVNPYGP